MSRVLRKQLAMWSSFSGSCRTARQPRVEEVSSGEDDAYCTEFCRRAAHLLYHRVLEKTEGPVGKFHISCCGLCGA